MLIRPNEQGASGAGPYLLACAYAIPAAKLKCVSVICGMGPPDIGMKGANWGHWAAFPYGWRYTPVWILRWYFSRDVFGQFDLTDEQRLEKLKSPDFLKKVTPHDLPIYKDENNLRMMLRGTREANIQGFAGIKEDAQVWCVPWEFKVEDIREDLPIQLWYGKNDTFVPPVHGIQIAARLSGRAEFHLEDETHTSIFFSSKRQAIVDILKHM